jgi:hypothetical protein
MEKDITNFLPQYPNIENTSEPLLNPYDNNFYNEIYHKKEFNELELSPIEDYPENPGEYLRHQQIISRFLSSYTPYDQLLLFHIMGTGKTCTAVSVIENIQKETKQFDGAIILCTGEGLISNFKEELIKKCTPGQYIPLHYEQLTSEQKVRRVNKLTKFYTFVTFETFAKKLSKYSDDYIIDTFSNKIIVIDEVHNLSVKDDNFSSDLNIYKEIHRFLHLVKNCKILLMSGTPMQDSLEEISDIMNLILPLDDQLPRASNFINQFLISNPNGIYNINDKYIDLLKSKFKGRVSYVKPMHSEVKKIFEGRYLGNLKNFLVYDVYMSEFQTKSYIIAYTNDKNNKKGGSFFPEARQASLFVFPDGTYGKAGFGEVSSKTGKFESKYINRTKRIGTDKFDYSIKPALRNEIFDDDHEKMLDNLAKFSSKYSTTIKQILESTKNGKLSFVYCEYVKGSGGILFSKLLSLFGFKQATGNEKTPDKRYAILNSDSSTYTQTKEIKDMFNNPNNKHGEYISVIIGSKAVSEGFSFNNIQDEHILTPYWNYSELDQAIARGWRFGSHKDLIKSGIIPSVNIYQHVSIPYNNEIESIELKLYEISEIKDINIKKIERIIKECAIDCELNKKRNYMFGYTNQRECDYTNCEYKCEGINNDLDIDFSTYQLYYNKNIVNTIISKIVDIFKLIFNLKYNDIIDYLNEYTTFDILTALKKIINENIIITNKYGFQCFLREKNNVYFLIDNISIKNNFFDSYYTIYPTIEHKTSFPKIINELYINKVPKIINDIFFSKDSNDIINKLIKLEPQIQLLILENCIISLDKGYNFNSYSRDVILDYFKNYFKKFGDLWIVWLLYDDEDTIKCLKSGNNSWNDCTESQIEIYKKFKKEEKNIFEQVEYGYYGLYNSKSKEFCIKKVSEEEVELFANNVPSELIRPKKLIKSTRRTKKTTKNINYNVGDKIEAKIGPKNNWIKGEIYKVNEDNTYDILYESDKRDEPSGRRCTNWKRPEITHLMADVFKIPVPENSIINSYDEEKLLRNINTNNYLLYDEPALENGKLKYEPLDIDMYYTIDDLRRSVYWGQYKVKELCENLQNWLFEQKLIQENPNCGTANKRK